MTKAFRVKKLVERDKFVARPNEEQRRQARARRKIEEFKEVKQLAEFYNLY